MNLDPNIRIEPTSKSKHKKIELHFDRENSLRAKNEFYIVSNDLNWNGLGDIKYPGENLEYLDKFELFDNAVITINLETKNDKYLEIKDIPHNGDNERNIIPKPEFKLDWYDDCMMLNVSNYNDKYIMKVIIDGKILPNNDENVFIIKEEGKHVIYIEYVDDEFLLMNHCLEVIEYKKKYDVPAPSILRKETKDKYGVITKKEGFIYYHPASKKELNTNVYIDENGQYTVDELVVNLGEIDLNIKHQKIEAYTLNSDPNMLLYNTKTKNASSKSQKIRMPNDNSSAKWKAQYKDYIKYDKLWNIEYFYIQEFKELFRGEEYFDLAKENNINVDESIHLKPEIIGLDSDNTVFSAFPHVKRYPYHNYYAYVNREIYELGQSIDTNQVPINKKIEFIVGCEYRNPNTGEIKTGEVKLDNVVLDTTFPSYPKLTEDLESIMTEPFEVQVIREKSGNEFIEYESKLNGEEWDINTPRVRDRYIFEDGEYMLDMVARKKSNNTFRYRSAYFTVNTFQHVPLQPLKTKIIPLKITNTPTIGTEGELVLDANSGNYGFVRDGEIYSPTATLSTELLTIEENSNDISKLYLSNRQHLDTLLERYSINSINMGALFNGENGAVLRYAIINEEYKRIKKEMEEFKNTIDKDRKVLDRINNELDEINGEISIFKQEIEKTNKSAFNIIRNLSLVSHSNLRKAMRINAELKNKLNNMLLDKTFEIYKEKKMRDYDITRAKLQNGEI